MFIRPILMVVLYLLDATAQAGYVNYNSPFPTLSRTHAYVFKETWVSQYLLWLFVRSGLRLGVSADYAIFQ